MLCLLGTWGAFSDGCEDGEREVVVPIQFIWLPKIVDSGKKKKMHVFMYMCI